MIVQPNNFDAFQDQLKPDGSNASLFHIPGSSVLDSNDVVAAQNQTIENSFSGQANTVTKIDSIQEARSANQIPATSERPYSSVIEGRLAALRKQSSKIDTSAVKPIEPTFDSHTVGEIPEASNIANTFQPPKDRYSVPPNSNTEPELLFKFGLPSQGLGEIKPANLPEQTSTQTSQNNQNFSQINTQLGSQFAQQQILQNISQPSIPESLPQILQQRNVIPPQAVGQIKPLNRQPQLSVPVNNVPAISKVRDTAENDIVIDPKRVLRKTKLGGVLNVQAAQAQLSALLS